MKIYLRNGVEVEDLGLIPEFLSEHDKRPAKEQFNERYANGGGWQPFGMDKWRVVGESGLKYPGDPVLQPVAIIEWREERIFVYPAAIVRIVQPDGSFEVARMD